MLALECAPHRSGRRLAMASVAAAAAAPLRSAGQRRGEREQLRGVRAGAQLADDTSGESSLKSTAPHVTHDTALGVPWFLSPRPAAAADPTHTRIVGRPRCFVSQRLVTQIRMAEGATPAHICSVVPDWQHPTSSSPTQLCTRRRCLTLAGGGEACEERGHNATSYPCGVDEPIQRRRTCSATASTNPYGVVISDHVRLDFDGS